MSDKNSAEFKGFVITIQTQQGMGDEVSVIEADTIKQALQIYFVTISTNGLQKGFNIVPVSFMRCKS